jgi:hypothetical protein
MYYPLLYVKPPPSSLLSSYFYGNATLFLLSSSCSTEALPLLVIILFFLLTRCSLSYSYLLQNCCLLPCYLLDSVLNSFSTSWKVNALPLYTSMPNLLMRANNLILHQLDVEAYSVCTGTYVCIGGEAAMTQGPGAAIIPPIRLGIYNFTFLPPGQAGTWLYHRWQLHIHTCTLYLYTYVHQASLGPGCTIADNYIYTHVHCTYIHMYTRPAWDLAVP